MKFLALQPFIPSGADLEKAKAFFRELGFSVTWDAGDYAGFQRDDCRFILQRFHDDAFAQNLMVTVNIDDAGAFYQAMQEKQLAERFGVKIQAPVQQPYGLEVNVIDPAGVCWHFVQ